MGYVETAFEMLTIADEDARKDIESLKTDANETKEEMRHGMFYAGDQFDNLKKGVKGFPT